ncbi:hypothetical protein GOP47_0015868 [Adiantum capillus-veneris]|uniref:X8 domain-containing protein n=1 Tax=Adiantum capillus-veneris TaxID=13818 RepID=A0A9D4UL99_ADICA|nr:hypothetical protein GOP47_0015868 [Adiantum capillus-veneris]
MNSTMVGDKYCICVDDDYLRKLVVVLLLLVMMDSCCCANGAAHHELSSMGWTWLEERLVDINRNQTASSLPPIRPRAPAGKTWCVAKPTAIVPESLQAAMDYACGVDPDFCKSLQPGQPCFLPNTLYAHASFAFNAYWQARRSQPDTTCDFGGNAVLINVDPTYSGSTCKFS